MVLVAIRSQIKNFIFLSLLAFQIIPTFAETSDLPTQAEAALAKAVNYLGTHVATNGGYLWWYSPDLTERAGEGKASETQIWVQPPGTPLVGFAYLRAYEKTKDCGILKRRRKRLTH